MTAISIEKFKLDHELKVLVQQRQYEQWLKRFFYLNEKLNEDYDVIYQDSFYVVFYELLTSGSDYANDVLKSVKKSGRNTKKINFYEVLTAGLAQMRNEFTDKEFNYIEYRRHSASHIFQNHYENRISKNGRFVLDRKGRAIDEIKNEMMAVILEYGSDEKFDIYMMEKLHPIIEELREQLSS